LFGRQSPPAELLGTMLRCGTDETLAALIVHARDAQRFAKKNFGSSVVLAFGE
jgi:hypothetical protein